mmetsp:Transcript_17039/g.41232  ORF Transcript_17039/g.41232 Transcript_17039/m.41232 type:complete len:233 (-) Transcript_17039:537-1235(-)
MLREKRMRHALLARAARTAYAMHVVLGVAGKVEVDHRHHLLDVEPARRHVRRDHHGALPRLEPVERARAGVLVLVAVDRRAANRARERALQHVAHLLGRAEHDDARARALLADDVLQQPLLLAGPLVHDLDDLRHVLVRHEVVCVADVDDRGVVQELAGQTPHLLGPRGREEERLALARNAADNLADLGLKAHVKHAISLVEHQVRDLVQVDLASLQEVIEAPGGRNHHLRA